ncbi:MAG: hypothetical protein V7K67_20645 [Nostoc sp.]|uniref:hypothetical protein n=1 Tax=Nostoc sp. TaxID=1180 RepID=UPI002FF63CC6
MDIKFRGWGLGLGTGDWGLGIGDWGLGIQILSKTIKKFLAQSSVKSSGVSITRLQAWPT